MHMERFGTIILGAGHAGAEAAFALRKEGYQEPVLLAGDEPVLPYQRPPLSKTYLADEVSAEGLLIREASAYRAAGITCWTQARAVTIDPAAHAVTFADGRKAAYGKLIYALGARPRQLDLAGVHYIRTLADIDGLRPHAKAGARAAIIGGGYIGLETAAMLKKLGLKVSVHEAMERVLQRVTAPVMSEFYTRIHREEGVEIFTGKPVDVKALQADVIIAGIGVLPNVELAEQAGLGLEAGGLRVDAQCRTSDPDIYAAGDCTSFHSPHYGRLLRLESVQNANDQARVAAANIAGRAAAYDALPWFWSDEYDLKLQIAGLSQGHDTVVLRGNPQAGRSFAAFYLKDGEVIAVDAVNRPKEFMLAKRWIAARATPEPARIADESIAVNSLL